MNSENYERDPQGKLAGLLADLGWRLQHGRWWKKDSCLLSDQAGVFLFQWTDRWTRTHGLAYQFANQNLFTTHAMTLSDGKLCLESGVFTAFPKRKSR